MYITFLTLLLSVEITPLFSTTTSDVVVASYNLWNVMFHWDIRKYYIAEMIQSVNSDIIGFQEVRANNDMTHTQLDDLQELLPEFQHKVFIPVEYVHKNNLRPGWEYEGLGFLSRHQILRTVAVNLTTPFDSVDKNSRSFVHVQFLIGSKDLELNVILVHFTYDKRAQCSNVYELMKYIYNIGVENVVILGDFNVYDDFLTPIKALMNGHFELDTLCEDIGEIFTLPEYQATNYKFLDAWVRINPNLPGYTFSNMPDPGLINRPDRILASTNGIQIVSTLILGKGEFYRRRYRSEIHKERYRTILRTAKEGRITKEQNSTCSMDCGPHGSCRCGICISGGDQNNCAPNQCNECSASKLTLMYLLIVASLPFLTYNLLFFVLLFLGVFQPPYRRLIVNKLRLRRFSKWTIVIVNLIVLALLLLYAHYMFNDASRLVSMQMMEETYPSDHLMVVARLNII